LPVKPKDPIRSLMALMFRAHPWHGVELGANAPSVVTCFIEIVPTDTVKYELDKHSGLLKVDRPQLFSNFCPALYGLMPQTYCGERVAKLCQDALPDGDADEGSIVGDGDPLDVCVLTEKTVTHGDLLLQAIPIGGLRMLDGQEADDKIIAVLEGDAVYGGIQDISDCSDTLINRLRHYFLTYKQSPDEGRAACRIVETYGREEAHDVIRMSQDDYEERFQGIERLLG
jgi:inorganic pyrophosphatase